MAEVAYTVFEQSGAYQEWDLERMGVGHYDGASIAIGPHIPQVLWRLYRLHSSSCYGVLQFFTGDLINDRTEQLAASFKRCGVEPDESSDWLAIGMYHGKATLLLHRDSHEVAGLEPAPANRVRRFSPDLFTFVNDVAIGPRHHELCYDERDHRQRRDSHRWMEFLEACGLQP